MRRTPRKLVPNVAAAVALAVSGCADVKLGRPDLLWLLWVVPLLAAFFVYSTARGETLLRRFAAPRLLEQLLGSVSRPRRRLRAALVVLATLLLVLAMSEVKYGFSWEEVRRRGVDVVVALDVSDSMLVEDATAEGSLTRLERAKREIADLLRMLEGDRVGLVAFAGAAFLECPLTLDYGAAELFLSAIDTELIPVKGTAIGEALRVATAAFEDSASKSRAVILITDGEDHGGEALAAAEAAKTAGVHVFTIGIGRDEGAPIPDGKGGFRRDSRGELILSKLDETSLQKIALTTGGRYVRSVTGDVDLEEIYTQGIRATLEAQDLGSRRRQHWEERFQWLLGPAILLLMLEAVLPERRRRRASRDESGDAEGTANAAAGSAAGATVPTRKAVS